MAKKLYIGGLPYQASENELKDFFSQAGTVASVSIIIDKMTGRSRGFGFVEMSSDEEAESAVQQLNGKEFQGRRLTVNEARPMEERPQQRRDDRGGGGWGGGERRERRQRY